MLLLERIGQKKSPRVILSQLNIIVRSINTFICRCLDVKQELDDFTEGSRQLEAELEVSLKQQEKTIRDLKSALNQLQIDNESLRVSK